MNIYVISSIIAAFICWLLVAIVYSNSKHNPKRKTFAWVTGLIGIWTLFPAVSSLPVSERTLLFLVRLIYIPALFVPSTFLSFMIYVMKLDNDKKAQTVLRISYLVSTAFIPFVFSNWFIQGVYRFMPGFAVKPGFLYTLFIVYFGFMYLYASIRLLKVYRKASGYFQIQLKYVGLAFAIAFISGLIHFSSAFHVREVIPHDIFVASYSIMMTYAIVRYRLMDIRVYITRVGIFLLITALVASMSFGAMSAVKNTLKSKLGESWIYIPLLIAMLLAVSGYAGAIYLIRKMDERRLQRFRETQEALEISGRGMIEVDDVKRLAKIIPRYLTMFYYSKLKTKISHATIFLFDDIKRQYLLASSAGEERYSKGKALLLNSPLCNWFIDKRKLILAEKIAKPQDIDVLRIDDIDYWMGNDRLLNIQGHMHAFLKELKREMETLNSIICVPSFFKDNLIGFLLLGNKGEGIYTEEEMDLFSRLAANAAAAFRSAQLSELIRRFEEEKAEAEKLIATGELLGSVRHEMGNIINKISTPLQMIQYGTFKNNPEKEKRLIENTVKGLLSAKTILKYVDEYKEKSRSNERKFYNLLDSIDKALSYSNGLIEKWKIRIFLTVNPGITVKGKKTFPDIFKHLLINSCYGMEDGGGELSLAARLIKETDEIEIIQTDTGTDLTQEIKKHKTMGGELFAEQGKLGGINLFLARRIVKDHKGALQIESNNEMGTKFIIKLPLEFDKTGLD